MYKSIFKVMCIVFFICVFSVSCRNDCKKADKLIREGQYDKAIEILENYVKSHENDHTGYMLLGDAYVAKARKIGGYGYNPATREIVLKGTNYYKESYRIKKTRLVEDKLAIASGMLEAP